MLNRKIALVYAAVAATTLFASLSVSSSAQACPGVIATIVGNCQLDEIHRAVGSPLNQFVPQQPIGQPAAPPPIPAYAPGQQMAMQGPMPFCATPVGAFLLPPAQVPNGTPCWHQDPGGPFLNGQVIWR